jgi:predicted RNase H-like HicB family nuclease
MPISTLAKSALQMQIAPMSIPATFTARVLRDGKWYVAFSPEFPEGNGQGLTEEEALESLRESILLLLEDRREDARASLGSGEKLIPLALA